VGGVVLGYETDLIHRCIDLLQTISLLLGDMIDLLNQGRKFFNGVIDFDQISANFLTKS